jgi:vitamin B12 transporter
MIEQESENFTPQTADGIKRSRKALSFAADYHGEFFGVLNLHGAVRHDDNDTLPDFDTYRVAGSLRVPRTPFRVHGSAGTGVKAPTMFEQFGVIPASFVPNPDLQPEKSFGWDTGVEMASPNGRGTLDVTWFEADLTNKIDTLFLPGFLSTPVNLEGKSDRKGLEVAGRLKLTDWLAVGGDYTRLKASEPDDELERRRPKHSGRVFVDASFAGGRGSLSASAAYNGEMIDFAFLLPAFTATRATLDDYTLVSIAASYEIRPGVELFARGENVLDEDYQEVFGFASADAAVFGGLRLTLGGGEGALR